MPLATNLSAYEDCFDLFDRAKQSPRGIRVSVLDQGAAYQLRLRLYYSRRLLRDEARTIYAHDDPAYGISAFDALAISIREVEEQWWVFIEPRSVIGEIQELGAAE